jgi:hypothetical protein
MPMLEQVYLGTCLRFDLFYVFIGIESVPDETHSLTAKELKCVHLAWHRAPLTVRPSQADGKCQFCRLCAQNCELMSTFRSVL